MPQQQQQMQQQQPNFDLLAVFNEVEKADAAEAKSLTVSRASNRRKIPKSFL